jgi:hypothetical protein
MLNNNARVCVILSDSGQSRSELVDVSLFEQQRRLKSDTSAIVKLDKNSFLKEAILKSSGAICIMGVDKETCAEASHSSDIGFLGDGALNLFFHAFPHNINLVNEVIS